MSKLDNLVKGIFSTVITHKMKFVNYRKYDFSILPCLYITKIVEIERFQPVVEKHFLLFGFQVFHWSIAVGIKTGNQ